jgi:hypothetical protein
LAASDHLDFCQKVSTLGDTIPIIDHLSVPSNIARLGSLDRMTRASQTISLLVVLFAVWHTRRIDGS